ncbi:MAG: SatD family protein [Bacteroidota bacterium]
MKHHYCVIIGDIDKSRTLQRRARIQEKFKEAVAAINKEFKNDIASKFLITLGDEFQGVLLTPLHNYQLICRFQELIEPVSFTFGVGIGTLATPLNTKEAIGMDGECFYRARNAIQQAKKEKKKLVYDFDDPAAVLVNAIVASVDAHGKLLNATQQKIAQLRNKGLTQRAIAQKLRITKQAVSKAISTTMMKEMEESVAALEQFFRQYTPEE